MSFEPFSTTHLAVALGSVTLGAALCVAGRRAGPHEPRLRGVWIASVYVWQLCNVVYFLAPERFSLGVSLPLHVCDLSGWVAAFALHTRARWLRILLFYWGFGLSTQAYITPTLDEGPGTWRFWLFWGTHFQIIASAAYDLVVLRFRPTWRTMTTAMGVLVAYAAIVVPVNELTGWNYGYIGRTTSTSPPTLDLLGPWPGRLAVMAAITLAIFAVLTAPFEWFSRGQRVAAPRGGKAAGE